MQSSGSERAPHSARSPPEPSTPVHSVLLSLPDVSHPLIQRLTHRAASSSFRSQVKAGLGCSWPGNLSGRPYVILLTSCAFTWFALSREFSVQGTRGLITIRHPLPPFRMATTKHIENNKCWRRGGEMGTLVKCWQRGGEMGTLVPCWQEHNMVQPWWETGIPSSRN